MFCSVLHAKDIAEEAAALAALAASEVCCSVLHVCCMCVARLLTHALFC